MIISFLASVDQTALVLFSNPILAVSITRRARHQRLTSVSSEGAAPLAASELQNATTSKRTVAQLPCKLFRSHDATPIVQRTSPKPLFFLDESWASRRTFPLSTKEQSVRAGRPLFSPRGGRGWGARLTLTERFQRQTGQDVRKRERGNFLVSGAVEREYHFLCSLHLRLRHSHPGGRLSSESDPVDAEPFDKFHRPIPVPHAFPPFLPVFAVVKSCQGHGLHHARSSRQTAKKNICKRVRFSTGSSHYGNAHKLVTDVWGRSSRSGPVGPCGPCFAKPK